MDHDVLGWSSRNDAEAVLVTAALGLDEPWFSMGGDEGTVHFLEDGRVLKLTSSKSEAALCMALLEAQETGMSHPCLPRIDSLHWFEVEVDLSPMVEGPVSLDRYAIVRESFEDHFHDEVQSASFSMALAYVQRWVCQGDEDDVTRALTVWKEGSEVSDIVDGLRWLRERAHIVLGDVRPSNVGVSRSGRSGMRDLGRAEVPQRLLDRVLTRDMPALPLYTPVSLPGY